VKGSTKRRLEREEVERDHRSSRDPLQVRRQEWMDSDDRMERMLGYVSDAHSPASARLRADPNLPITKPELDRWLLDADNADMYLMAQDFGEAKLTDELRSLALNKTAGRKGSHVATQVMLRVNGRTPAQIQRNATEKPKEDLVYQPPEELIQLSDEELAKL
jgi:hypothetical protein